MSAQIGFLVLEVATVASFGIPGVGPFIGAGLAAFGGVLRMVTSKDGATKPPSLDKALILSSIDAIVKDNLGRQHANNIASVYFAYQEEMNSLVWSEDDTEPPSDISESRLKDLRKDLRAATGLSSQLLMGIANLEDHNFGLNFASGLILGQSTHLQLLKILVVIDSGLEKELPVDQVRKLMALCERYETSLGKLKNAIDLSIQAELFKQVRPGDRAGFTQARDKLLSERYQGNPELVPKATSLLRAQKADWRKVLKAP
jgi:hypothetical protein